MDFVQDLDGSLILCFICGKPFTLDQWNERHENHKPFCDGQSCDCDMPAHVHCCPCVHCDKGEDEE